MTVSWLALFPFSAGILKNLLFPPLMPLHLPKVFPSPSVHVRAPTHGWTFHPTSRVTLPWEDSLPLMFVIWYLGFEFLRWMMPGLGSSAVPVDRGRLDLLDAFEGFSGVRSS